MAATVNKREKTVLAWACYALSVITIVLGACLSARLYPAGFDWTYDVMSALASRKHNPEGYAWFAAALGGSMVLLWPVVGRLSPAAGVCDGIARFSVGAFRVGLIAGMLVAIDRLVFFHLSDVIRKGHEALALLAFVGIYVGVLGFYVHHLHRRSTSVWPLVLVALPIAAVGFSEAFLYLGQRDLGWLDHNWRETGIAAWMSFAFWQWLATAALWAGIGHLLLLGREK